MCASAPLARSLAGERVARGLSARVDATAISALVGAATPDPWQAQSSTRGFLHERADSCLVGCGQPRQREGGRRHGAFSSWARSFIAARSSSVNPATVLPIAMVLRAAFCVAFVLGFLSAIDLLTSRASADAAD
jgi:hypothetical protein